MSALVQTAPDFLSDFLTQSARATQRIWCQSMNFEAGQMMDKLAPVLKNQADAGIDVQLEIDWVAQRFVHGYLPLKPVLDRSKREYAHQLHQKNNYFRQDLTNHNVKITVVNPASLVSQLFPAFRRNHIKLFVVDNRYAWLGGVNLLDRAFECQDFMVRYDNPEEVEILAQQFIRVNANRWSNNQEIKLNPTDQLLVDAGKVGRSIIYDRAVTMIKQAKKQINFVSQFVPEGALLRALLTASREGKEVNIVNSYAKAKQRWSSAHRTAYQVFLNDISHTQSVKFRHSADRLHAKLLITDQESALFGSHNFVDTGVLMGTEELAVQTQQPELVQQLFEFYTHLT